jgi:hypothetical protein
VIAVRSTGPVPAAVTMAPMPVTDLTDLTDRP